MRDLKTLMKEAQALRTDEARLAWIDSLTPEEQEAFLKNLALLMEAVQEFMDDFYAQLGEIIKAVKPVIADILAAAREAGWQPSQNDSDDAPLT
jgi:hypothetical protein